jgi:cytochrome c biogenesis protein CcmG/thiol:disulfide interchange protein DsbE
MTRVRWIVTGVAVFVIALVIVLAASLGHSKTGSVNALVGKPAPAFTLDNRGGGKTTLASLGGKVVVVNFWNDWCIPCQQESSDLQQLYDAHRNDPQFAYVGVVHDAHARADIESYVHAQKVTWPVAFDPGEEMALHYGVTGQPETFVIDSRGVVRQWVSGPIDPNKVEASIEAYEQEAA